MAVVEAWMGSLNERADPHSDVLALAGRPERRAATAARRAGNASMTVWSTGEEAVFWLCSIRGRCRIEVRAQGGHHAGP